MARKNPFIEGDFRYPYIKKMLKENIFDQSNGAPQPFYLFESAKYARVYTDVSNYQALEDLSVPGHKLYRWILYHMSHESDVIKFDDVRLCADMKVTERTLAAMKRNLVANIVISKKENNTYYTNPRFFCAGSRLDVYPNNGHQVAVIGVS